MSENKMDFDALVRHLNNLKIAQTSIEWFEDLSEEIYQEYFYEKSKTLAAGLFIDKHRWYSTGIEVLSLEGGLLGVEAVNDLYSEQMEVSDCCYTLKFFKMQEVNTISYDKSVS